MLCKDCDNYIPGGKCYHPSNKSGVTSPLQNADGKKCFTPKGASPEAAPTKKKAQKKEGKAPLVEVGSDLRRCKVCGRDLPLEQFRPVRMGRLFTCYGCMKPALTRGGKTRQGKTKPEPEPKPVAKPAKAPAAITFTAPVDDEREAQALVERLRALGYSGTIYKSTITI